ncbi:MAG: hypothetical protein IJY31_02510, partial [Muribaculaceae bacterium]|nr:hypothetical protein [Muribaculaceae bacterium]
MEQTNPLRLAALLMLSTSCFTATQATTAALPGGLYIAHKGGNILYKQNGTTYDTGIPAGAHPFQMQIYNDALYVA